MPFVCNFVTLYVYKRIYIYKYIYTYLDINLLTIPILIIIIEICLLHKISYEYWSDYPGKRGDFCIFEGVPLFFKPLNLDFCEQRPKKHEWKVVSRFQEVFTANKCFWMKLVCYSDNIWYLNKFYSVFSSIYKFPWWLEN